MRRHILDVLSDKLCFYIFKGPEWRRQRRLVNKIFNPDLMQKYVKVFNNKSRILVKKLQKIPLDHTFDVAEAVELCALETICCKLYR